MRRGSTYDVLQLSILNAKRFHFCALDHHRHSSHFYVQCCLQCCQLLLDGKKANLKFSNVCCFDKCYVENFWKKCSRQHCLFLCNYYDVLQYNVSWKVRKRVKTHHKLKSELQKVISRPLCQTQNNFSSRLGIFSVTFWKIWISRCALDLHFCSTYVRIRYIWCT